MHRVIQLLPCIHHLQAPCSRSFHMGDFYPERMVIDNYVTPEYKIKKNPNEVTDFHTSIAKSKIRLHMICANLGTEVKSLYQLHIQLHLEDHYLRECNWCVFFFSFSDITTQRYWFYFCWTHYGAQFTNFTFQINRGSISN